MGYTRKYPDLDSFIKYMESFPPDASVTFDYSEVLTHKCEKPSFEITVKQIKPESA